MNNEPLMDAVVQMVLFLELSDPAIVDEDAAVGIMEQVAVTLRKLGPADMKHLLRYVRRRASQAESEKERQSLENFASNLGLTPE